MKKKLSTYVCPHCGHEKEDKPAKAIKCDQHGVQVYMIEKGKGIVTK